MNNATTLGYALLGLLARRALSGYDLARQMKRPVGYFWQARHSQIYPELARLEAQGLVAHTVVEQHDRPDKKVYAITAAGREALHAWVTSETDEPPARDELVLRAFSLWLADPPAALALFREHERRHEAQLAQYREIEARLGQDTAGVLPPADTPEFATYAALQRGIGYEQEYAAWCRWVADQLEAAANKGGDPGNGVASRRRH
jgi:DNA-binding PadR family transcriptional regulator